MLGVIGFALQTTSPLVSQKILKFMTASYEYSHGQTDEVPPGIRYGVGLCFGLWAMQQASSLFMNQFLNRSLITGTSCLSRCPSYNPAELTLAPYRLHAPLVTHCQHLAQESSPVGGVKGKTPERSARHEHQVRFPSTTFLVGRELTPSSIAAPTRRSSTGALSLLMSFGSSRSRSLSA